MRTRLCDALAIRVAAFDLLERSGADVDAMGLPAQCVEVGGLSIQCTEAGDHGDIICIWPQQKGGKLYSSRVMPDGEVIITTFKRGEWERFLLGDEANEASHRRHGGGLSVLGLRTLQGIPDR
jgi:hypothetical protein